MAEKLVTIKVTLEEANEIRAALMENRALVSCEAGMVHRTRDEQNQALKEQGPRARASVTQRVQTIDNLLKDLGLPPI